MKALAASIFLPLLSMVALAACSASGPNSYFSSMSDSERVIHEEAASHKNLAGLLELCRTARSVEIFEGLPHPTWERELLAREQRRHDVFQNHDFSFYQPAWKLPDADRNRLISEVTSRRSFTAWHGPKSCGGFHPDFMMRFHPKDAVVEVHLCLGCGEAVFYGPQNHARVDIADGIFDRWKEIQKRDRRKRPIQDH